MPDLFVPSSLYGQLTYCLLFLGLFLFGITLMGNSLKEIAGNRLRIIIEKMTNTPIKGILMGIFITGILQSSSGVTVIVIALISAGLMNLKQGVAVIMGSNIGTTVTSILIGINIGIISPYLIIIGAVLVFFFKSPKVCAFGKTLLGFGLLFFGLDNMGSIIKVMASNTAWIDNFFVRIGDQPLLGVLTGSIITAIIQSSSAVIGIVQKLYASIDSFTIVAAIPIILGSNIGTTITALLASINGNRNGKRAAITHLIFNMVGTILFLIILVPFSYLMQKIENSFVFFENNQTATIALIHVIFNVTTTIILAFFINLLVKLVEKIIPFNAQEKSMYRIDCLEEQLISKAPGLAIQNAHNVICDMCEIVKQMFSNANEYMNSYDKTKFNDVMNSEDIVDYYDNKLHDYLAKITNHIISEMDVYEQTICFDTIRDLERIGDHCVNLVEFMDTRYSFNMSFHTESLEMINHMSRLLQGMLDDAYIAFKDNDKKMAARIRATEPQIDELEKKYRRRELNLMASGAIPNTDLHYVDILANLERIGDHANNIADNIRNNSLHDVMAEK